MDINHTKYLFHFRARQKNMNTEQHFLQIHISQPVISKNEFEKKKKEETSKLFMPWHSNACSTYTCHWVVEVYQIISFRCGHLYIEICNMAVHPYVFKYDERYYSSYINRKVLSNTNKYTIKSKFISIKVYIFTLYESQYRFMESITVIASERNLILPF